jgi:HTH-type transcriptional regulator/antitoxin HigA
MKTNGEKQIMYNLEINKTEKIWHPISRFIYVPHTEKEYNHLVELLDSLIDKVGEDENHPLAFMMEILGVLIEYYENYHVPEFD